MYSIIVGELNPNVTQNFLTYPYISEKNMASMNKFKFASLLGKNTKGHLSYVLFNQTPDFKVKICLKVFC